MSKDFMSQFTFVNTPHNYLTDKRVEGVRFNETPYEPKHFSSLSEWENERSRLKKELLIAAGLYPMPEKCPLDARIFDRRDFGDFTVEKVVFQSLPGFNVTGNLYRPKNLDGPTAGILNPHGHAVHGRLETSPNFNIPQRSVNFARNSMVSFSYDLVGFCDSVQIPHTYFGYVHDLWGENLFGLQLYNNIRVVDFMESLPDVDPKRIGATGSSCGGTQSFLLAAVDDRLSATMSCNLLSATYTGSCICENCATLRIYDSNIDFAYLIAPKRLMVVGSTGDWTSDVPDVVYPLMREVYALYNKRENMEYFYHEAPHNYNQTARERALTYFSEKLLGAATDAKEIPFDFSTVDDFKIYKDRSDADIPLYGEEEFFEMRKQDRLSRMEELKKSPDRGLLVFKDILKQATGTGAGNVDILNAPPPSHELYRFAAKSARQPEFAESDGYGIKKFFVTNDLFGAAIPTAVVKKGAADDFDLRGERVVLLLSTEGKKDVFSHAGTGSIVDDLLNSGCCVASADLFLTGEYKRPYGAPGRNFVNPDGRFKPTDSCMDNLYFSTYNYTDDAYRVQDVDTLARYFAQNSLSFSVGALGDAGKYVLCAAPFLSGAKKIYADVSAFDGKDDDYYVDNFFVPLFLGAGAFETCKELAEDSLVQSLKDLL